MVKILITGINSSLGKCFKDNIRTKIKNCRIYDLHRSSIDNKEKDVVYINHDLSKDDFYLDDDIDIVMHVASSVPSNIENEIDYTKVNVDGSINLFENIKLSNNAKIVNISSTAVYGDPDADVLYENSKKTRNNKYGLSKLMFEKAISGMFKHSSTQLLTCRIPVLLAKDVKNNFLSNWLRNIKSGNSITLFNPQSLINACVTGNDIFNFFFEKFYQNRTDNLICNLSSSEPIKIIDAAKFIMETIGVEVEIIEEHNNVKAQLISHDLAKKNGFKPATIKESLQSFMNYV